MVPEMQLSLLCWLEKGWEYSHPHLPFPSHTGHYITRLEELTEFIWEVQSGSKLHLCTHTRVDILSNTAPEADTICLGSRISESGVDLRGLRKPRLEGIT